jgi:hypothetical protein
MALNQRPPGIESGAFWISREHSMHHGYRGYARVGTHSHKNSRTNAGLLKSVPVMDNSFSRLGVIPSKQTAYRKYFCRTIRFSNDQQIAAGSHLRSSPWNRSQKSGAHLAHPPWRRPVMCRLRGVGIVSMTETMHRWKRMSQETKTKCGVHPKDRKLDVGQSGRPMWDHRCECLV